MNSENRQGEALAELRLSTAPTTTIKAAAAALGCDPRTVSVGIADGTIPAIKLGRRQVVLREKFLKLFEIDDE